MARLARKAPHVQPRSVGRRSQGAHRREVHAPQTSMRRSRPFPSCRATSQRQSNPTLRRGAFFRRCREGSAATSSCGSTSRSDPRLANGASANRLPCLRRARSSVWS